MNEPQYRAVRVWLLVLVLIATVALAVGIGYPACVLLR